MPEWTRHVRQRLERLQLRPEREAEIVEELSQHLDERYEELRRSGASEIEAERQAIGELLEPAALARAMRTLRQANAPVPITPGAPRGSLFRDLVQDLRYGVRMLRKAPGFAAAAIVTLALGVGVNSAIFSLVDVTLLRPLPLPQPDRLVILLERTPRSDREGVSPNNLSDWRQRTRSFAAIGGFVPSVASMVLSTPDGMPETIPRQWVTAGFFDALGVTPVVGRGFSADEDRKRANVVVLTESFWRARFNGDTSLIGRDIRLDGEPYTVVGVMPDEAQVLAKTSMWAMRPTEGLPPRLRAASMFVGVGRLKPGVTIDAASADLSAVAAGLAHEFPDTNADRGVTIEALHDAVMGADLQRTSLLFLGVVGFVLLICCANVASLLLARASARTRELATRAALGADRPRIIRQLLAESLVLAAIGGALGLAVGAAILRVAPSIVPEGFLPAAVTLPFDLRVAAFCAAAALFSGLIFGLAPAWQATDLVTAQAFTASSRTTTGAGGRLRNLLVAAEVATAVLLLVGAGLLLRTLMAVENVDRGYRAESVLTMIVDPLGSRYPTTAARLQFYETVAQEVMTIPGVRSVAWTSTLPMGRPYLGEREFEITGDSPPADGRRPTANYEIVSPSYFATLDLPIRAGRGFDERDTPDGVQVCIVNEAFVRKHLGGRSPIGQRVTLHPRADGPPVTREIVGVARQVKETPDETEDIVQIYVPLAQNTVDDIFLAVRPQSGDAGALAPSVRAAIARVDKEGLVSVRGVMTLEDIAWEATARHRFRAVLVVTFATLALLLAMVGLFGVIAYSVQQRVRDFGIRRALGASTFDVIRPVLGSALRVIGAGVVVGLALAVFLSRLLTTMLFGVEPLDPATFALVIGVLTVTAAVAIAGPAWRATRIDPAVALRSE